MTHRIGTSTAAMTIGVDTGGTFTDLVLIDSSRRIVATHKLLSTPDDPGRAVLRGIEQLLATAAKAQAEAADVASPPRVVHGSTVATNALLEGAGEATAFITTAGFEDLLHIARQDRPNLYALTPRRPDPPIARSACIGADERMDRDGQVLRPLSDSALAAVVEKVTGLGAASVAICLLHSYANASHERRLADALRQALPNVHITVSADLLPEHREYERAATCVINAVVAPRMARYIGSLSRALGEAHLRIMASHGGTLPPRAVIDQPVRTILSGPAGGALGAAAMARAAGIRRVITLDMGGTSTDVALIDGEPTMSSEGEAAGLPVRLPMIDMHTVGAGGGSIAWVDPGGALRVGPRSAGADPGPACYGRQRGDWLPTVTDAHVVLGHIAGDQVFGADLHIDRDAAVEAVAALGGRIGLDVGETAAGIVRVADATMTRAVQRVSLQRGRDPRQFVLLPFGGAGAMHACSLAEALGIEQVLAPLHPGLLSAVGMLEAAPKYVLSRTVLQRIEPTATGYRWPNDSPRLSDAWRSLADEADAAMAHESVDPARRIDRRGVDLRYVGQSYEITTPCDEGDPIEAFLREHQRLYGYTAPGKAIELVTARLTTGGAPLPVKLQPPDPVATASEFGRGDRASSPGPGQWRTIAREALRPGDRIEGGTIVREASATTLVPENWAGVVDDLGLIHLRLQRSPAHAR